MFTKSISTKFLVLSLMMGLVTFVSIGEARVRRRVSAYDNSGPETPLESGTTKKEFITGFSSGTYSSNTHSSEIKAIGALGYQIAPNIQIGGEGGLTITNYSGSSTAFLQAFFFGAFNFEPQITTSFYAKGGLGFTNASSSSSGSSNSSSSKTAFFIGLGKRFFLWPHLSYSPEFRITQSNSSSVTEIKALNFSIFF